jgi:hypothetical protein
MNSLDKDIGIISKAIVENVHCEFYVKKESDDSSTHYVIYLPKETNVDWVDTLVDSKKVSKSIIIIYVPEGYIGCFLR